MRCVSDIISARMKRSGAQQTLLRALSPKQNGGCLKSSNRKEKEGQYFNRRVARMAERSLREMGRSVIMWLIRKTTYFNRNIDSVTFYKCGGWNGAVFTAEPDNALKIERKAEAVKKMNELRKQDTNAIKISTYAVVPALTPMTAEREKSSAGSALLR